MRKRIMATVLIALVWTVAASPRAEEIHLVRNGTPVVALVLPVQADDDEMLAAEELQTHIEHISGVRLEIAYGTPPKRYLPVYIGAALAPRTAGELSKRSRESAAFILSAGSESVHVVGNSPEGTLFAAYELLEQLGCRWYLPGELGTVIPRTETLSLRIGETFQTPSFPHRHLQNVSGDLLLWSRRQRLGGLYFPGSHGISLLPAADLETEPELFALVDGKRQDSQLCISNPEVVRRATAAVLDYFEKHPDAPWIGMGPRDTGGFCEDERCRALDSGEIDPISGKAIRTDRYIWLFNQILESVHKRYPGKKIAFYAYDALKFPPRHQPLSPYIVPALAPITHDRIHGMSNPISPDRSFYRTIMADWCAIAAETFERGYYFNLACPGFPFSKIHAVRDETVVAHQLGVKGWRVQTNPSWASNGLTLYVAARLMWDVHTDVDALLAEFYRKFFGPAEKPMGSYLESLDTWFRDTECFTGGSYCMPKVFTPERMARCREWLDAAAAKTAGNPVFRARVRMFRLNHDRLEAFLEMLEARNRFDFAAARGALDRLYALTDTMLNYRLYPSNPGPEVPVDRQHRIYSREARLLYPAVAPSYIDRFWAPCTVAGYERTVTHGDTVAETPDVWDFLIDPSDAGESLRWFRDGRIGGNWQPLRTKTASWSDQGLHYYKGLAWYRTEVPIPEDFRGRRILLWFGGVDEHATVWLNGQLLGTSDHPGHGLPPMPGVFKPFDLDATDVVRFGESNFLAVKITNVRLNELGTGGITAPVLFWSPKGPGSIEAIFSSEEKR